MNQNPSIAILTLTAAIFTFGCGANGFQTVLRYEAPDAPAATVAQATPSTPAQSAPLPLKLMEIKAETVKPKTGPLTAKQKTDPIEKVAQSETNAESKTAQATDKLAHAAPVPTVAPEGSPEATAAAETKTMPSIQATAKTTATPLTVVTVKTAPKGETQASPEVKAEASPATDNAEAQPAASVGAEKTNEDVVEPAETEAAPKTETAGGQPSPEPNSIAPETTVEGTTKSPKDTATEAKLDQDGDGSATYLDTDGFAIQGC